MVYFALRRPDLNEAFRQYLRSENIEPADCVARETNLDLRISQLSFEDAAGADAVSVDFDEPAAGSRLLDCLESLRLFGLFRLFGPSGSFDSLDSFDSFDSFDSLDPLVPPSVSLAPLRA